jgi:hypothetical protein
MHHAPTDPASLENLHDIVEPSAISLWWPLAPAWWLLLCVLAVVLFVVVWRWSSAYYRNAYRRYALRLLRDASDVQSVAVILKRVAIAAFGRAEVAALTGDAWVSWLVTHADVQIPASVADALCSGMYQPVAADLASLRQFARQWICRHESFPSRNLKPET